ncbi:DUF1748-domain-containing protein [Cantharellus anzutake]|uniref:DUF1748-domain-containing protein n=1 Tax=Cantharellus anzutake TaxID=1750568 RepID=UPI0019064B44|nr:DUF1748-domain-containing protein [Cantharellus anzutake]KAF8337949.1 DUF1748-domain-containing protein [Cantharellus anzutake]
MLGKLVHYTIDGILLSTVIAGVKRSSGFEPQTSLITEPNVKSIADKFLGVGETVFDVVQAAAINSAYWKRSTSR